MPESCDPAELEELRQKLLWNGPPAPDGRFLSVFLDHNNKCNLRCRMCGFSDPRVESLGKYDLPRWAYDRIAAEAFPRAARVCLSLFTEPFMTRDGLVTAPVGTSLEEAKGLLQKHRIEKLPLVDDCGCLKGLITVKDIQKKRDFPHAATDAGGRLRVGAAVGVGADLEERVAALVAKGVDLVAVDTAHGHSAGVIRAIRRIKLSWPELPAIAGNVVTAEGAEALIAAGADAVKVGVGAGSICTTRVISGAGMAQMSAIYECAQVTRRQDIPLIADGGIKYSGDIVKAIAAGADVVMLGGLLAGMEESPGEIELYEGRRFKAYRGMGSLGAMQGYGKDRYASGQGGQGGQNGKLVPEGIEGRLPYKGPLHDFVYQLVGGLRSGMGYAGAATLEDLRTKTRLTRITGAGLIESHPHSVTITREAPNYQREG